MLTLWQHLQQHEQVGHHFRRCDVIDALLIGRHARYHLHTANTGNVHTQYHLHTANTGNVLHLFMSQIYLHNQTENWTAILELYSVQ